MYALIILAVAAFATVWGFRRGLARQTPALIGTAFGIVSARILGPGLFDVLYNTFTSPHGHVEQNFVYFSFANGIIFLVIFSVFAFVTAFLGKALKRDDRTILDNLGGGLYALFNALLITSLLLNMLLSIDLHSGLLKAAKSDDGNIVTEVMLISPALLGGDDVEDLEHEVQLEEAKKIS